MKTITFNDDNLSINDIEETVTKVRAIIVNEDNEIVLARYNDLYLLPGGSVDNNENLNEALIRELKEETGMNFENTSLEPFVMVEQYNKAYPKRDDINFSDRLSKTYYYLINTDEKINKRNMKLTLNELNHDFSAIRVNLNDIEKIVHNHFNDNPRNKYFKRELLAVIDYYKSYRKEE